MPKGDSTAGTKAKATKKKTPRLPRASAPPPPGPEAQGPSTAPAVHDSNLIVSPHSFGGEKAMRTMEAIKKERKIRTTIPLIAGEPPTFEVNINGVKFSVKRGVDVEIYESVYNIIRDRLVSDGLLARVSAEHQAKMDKMDQG